MKKCLCVLFALILALPFAVFAEPTIDYGTELNIVIDPFVAPGENLIIDDPLYLIPDFNEFVKASCLRDMANTRRFHAWSPDGTKIAVVDGANSTLWIVPATGGDPVLLDYKYGHGFATIAYSWDEEDERWSMGYDVSKLDYHKIEYSFIKFSPDGRKVMYSTNIIDTERGSFNDARTVKNPIPSIESIDIETGEIQTVIEEGRAFDISKDGRYIVYTSFDSRVYTDPPSSRHNGALAVLDTVTGETRYLVDYHSASIGFDITGCFYPTLSPDGATVAYCFNKQIYTVPFNGGTPEQISNFDNSKEELSPYYLSYSPDGKWLLATRGFELVVINVENKTAFYALSHDVYDQQFTNTNMNRHDVGKWSPDGTKISYVKSCEPKFELGHTFGTYIYTVDFNAENYATGKDTPILVETEKPSAFGIAGNYPNPFNPSTTIDFTLDASDVVTLDIYNAAGQKVKSLVDMTLGASKHSVVWDGRDDNGAQVSSGAYIARLSSGGKVTSRQMMLMK